MTTGRVFWLFGYSGAGKTTLAGGLAADLRAAGRHVLVLDGDDLRAGLCQNLGFSEEGRAENVRRAAELAKLASDQGAVVIAALITPTEHLRQLATRIIGRDRLDLVWVDVPLAVCQQRDAKGLYRRAAAGSVPLLTGVGAPFEAAASCDLQLRTDSQDVMLASLQEYVRRRLG